MDNLRNITPAITGIKTGTRALKDSAGNYILTGIGGDFIPAGQGSRSDPIFYKCATVDTATQTWTGYKAILSGGVYSFEGTATAGLSYTTVTPVIGTCYTEGALAQAILYEGTQQTN